MTVADRSDGLKNVSEACDWAIGMLDWWITRIRSVSVYSLICVCSYSSQENVKHISVRCFFCLHCFGVLCSRVM